MIRKNDVNEMSSAGKIASTVNPITIRIARAVSWDVCALPPETPRSSIPGKLKRGSVVLVTADVFWLADWLLALAPFDETGMSCAANA